jgi:hypothetical protein
VSSICVSPLSFIDNGLIHTFPRQRTKQWRIVGRAVFYAVRVLWKESLWVCLYILLLQGNGSVNTFHLRRRIFGGVKGKKAISSSQSFLLFRRYCTAKMKNANKIVVREPVGRRPYGIPTRW